jgi:hypothetical protein
VRGVAALLVVGVILGVVLSMLLQKGTDEDRRMGGVAFPSRFAMIVSVAVVVVLLGSFFVHWD